MRRTKEERQAIIGAEEALMIEVWETICTWMGLQNISNAQLAKSMGKPEKYIKDLMGGDDITVRELGKIIHCLGGVARLQIGGKK